MEQNSSVIKTDSPSV